MESISAQASPHEAPRIRIANFRWAICSLLFFATVIAYVDRGVIGFLEKYLEHVIGWNSIQYGT